MLGLNCPSSRTMRKFAFAMYSALTLSACASYQRQPLGTVPALPSRVGDVQVDATSLPFPQLAVHRFDPADGLDETEVAILAVANNPDLRLARDDLAIAHAQAFAAGLLPDPQLSFSHDLSNNSAGPDATKAFSLGLSYDINSLIQRVVGARSARAEERKTSLTLLWQEWQVVSQARLLFTKLVHGRRLIRVLDDNRRLFADRVGRTTQAQERGLVASDTVLPALAALQDIDKQLYDAHKQANQNARDLNALLGLDVSAELPLQETGGAFPAAVTPDQALAELSRRRPDLLALAAAYQAQDQRYLGAILAQFPALNVGLTRARDTSNIYSNALGVTLALPFLNGNRGNIAIEHATRQKLYDEYRRRVQASRSEIAALLAQRARDGEQLLRVRSAVAQVAAAIERAGVAFRAGTVDALAYTNARGALLARQAEQIALEQQIAEQNIALQTLLGVEPSTPSNPDITAVQSPR
jgi:outer membrane protein TolC